MPDIDLEKSLVLFFQTQKKFIMGNLLYVIVVVLVILWLLGYVGGYTSSGLIHILLVIAVIVLLLRIISGRKVV